MSELRSGARPKGGPSWGHWVRPHLRLGPVVLLSAGALLGLPAAGVTVASAPVRSGVVTVANGPATVSGLNGDGRTGPALLGAPGTAVGCCLPPPSRTSSYCMAC